MTSKADTLKEYFPPRFLDLEMQQDYVIVQLPEPPEKKGSIIMSEETKENMRFVNAVGKVMAMGPGVFKQDPNAEREPGAVTYDVGDYVLVPMHGGRQRKVTDANTGKKYDILVLEVIKIQAKVADPLPWLD